MTEVGNLKQKLDDIDNLLVDTIENYHTPGKFFTYSSAVIQATRTFTLAVQSNKATIPSFDKWYEPWQAKMRADSRMKWLHDKRNDVAHTDILSSDSYAAIFTITDYRNANAEEHFDYRTSNADLLTAAQQKLTKNPGLTHTSIAIERKYIVEVDGQPQELIQLLFYGFNYLRLLYSDLLLYLETGRVDKIPDDLSDLVEKESVIDDWYRFSTFKIADGKPIQGRSIRIERDNKAIKEFIKDYGEPPKKLSKGMSIGDASRIVFDLAERVIAHGDSFIPTVYIRRSDGYLPLLVTFKDRAEKLKFAFDLPALLEQHKATAVIFVCEAWTMDAGKMLKRLNEGKSVDRARKKSERLWLTALTENLETIDMISAINRTEQSVDFGETNVSSPDPESLNFLRPTYLWWKSKKSTSN